MSVLYDDVGGWGESQRGRRTDCTEGYRRVGGGGVVKEIRLTRVLFFLVRAGFLFPALFFLDPLDRHKRLDIFLVFRTIRRALHFDQVIERRNKNRNALNRVRFFIFPDRWKR